MHQIFEYFLTRYAHTLDNVNVLFVLVLGLFWGSVDCERAYSLIARLKTAAQSTMSVATLRQQLIVHSYMKGMPREEWVRITQLIAAHFLGKKRRSPTIAAGTPISNAKDK